MKRKCASPLPQQDATPNSSHSKTNMGPPLSTQKRKTTTDEHATTKLSKEITNKQTFDFPEYSGLFTVLRELGRGTFGTVYQAVKYINDKTIEDDYYGSVGGKSRFIDNGPCAQLIPRRHYALKRIACTQHPDFIIREVEVLHLLRNQPHIVRIFDGIRKGDSITLVLEYVPHQKFRDYYRLMDVNIIATYIRQLLESLAGMHECGVVHRDVKPTNCLFNPCTGLFRLVDFGLAEMRDNIPEDRKKRKNIGTRGFRAPEILMNINYNEKVDIWNAGVILLSILSGRYPFFQSVDNVTALCEIMALFGVDELQEVAIANKREINHSDKLIEAQPAASDALSLRLMCRDLNKWNDYFNDFPESLFDLALKLLRVDSKKRITAKEALRHKFFKVNS